MVETKLSIDENEREKWYFGHMVMVFLLLRMNPCY
jgi:hypothetical protein